VGELPWNSPAFNVKRGGNAGQREDSKLAAVGLVLTHTDQLAQRLRADFLATHYGYRQFAALNDPLVQAFASSRLRAAISGVGRNLLEARLHEHHVHRTVGPNGLPWPGPTTTIAEDLARDELELHIAGFFRSLSSTLDCLAAVLIGVARVPRSLARADLLDVLRLDAGKASRRLPGRPLRQAELWTELRDLVKTANQGPPANWLAWTSQTRNALLHRGRGLTKLTNRAMPISRPMYVEGSHPPHELVRYDPHLSKRPWLTDLQNLVIYGEPFDHWLVEAAQQTVSGLRRATNDLCEDAAQWALACWRDDATQATLAADTSAWAESAIPHEFEGFQPHEGATSDLAIIAPDEQEIIKLAQRLLDDGYSVAPPERHTT
jgi:hypothetical protein